MTPVRRTRFRAATRHLRRLLLLCCALAVVAACATTDDEPVAPQVHAQPAYPVVGNGTVTTQRNLNIGGMKRTYLAVQASARRKGLPLLIVLHGRGITAQQESTRTGFLPYAERGAADLVYPLGINESWNAGHGCCGAAVKKGVDDATFLSRLTTDAQAFFGSDPRRVYLVGYSNGAKLSFEQVCRHPGTYAALATYGAVPLASCPGGRPLSEFMASGTNDPVVRTEHSSSSSVAALQAAVADWRQRDKCTGRPVVTHTGPLTRTVWTGCADGTELTEAVYSGLTHFWPTGTRTGAAYTTPVGPDAAAAKVMWDFLSRQRLPLR